MDARVTIPYWNWGLGTMAEVTSILQDDRIGPMGSGGANGLEVVTGYFAENPNALNSLGWSIHPVLQRFGSGLQRNATLNTGVGFDQIFVENAAVGPSHLLFWYRRCQ